MSAEQTALFLVHVLGFAGFLWLGLYLLTRGARSGVAVLTGATALVTSCFFLTGGLLSPPRIGVADTLMINRATWWTAVVPPILWLHVSLRFNAAVDRAPWRMPVLWAGYSAAVVLTLGGTATDIIRNYHSSLASTAVSGGPAYILYVVYLVACAGFAAVNFGHMSSRSRLPLMAQTATTSPVAGRPDAEAGISSDVAVTATQATSFRLLLWGSVCFLAGAGLLAFDVLQGVNWGELLGYLLLLTGLGAVGATMALYSALLLGKDVRADVIYSLTGLAVLLAIYLAATGLLVGFPDLHHVILVLLLAALITAGHTLGDVAHDRLDALFFSPVVREERTAARAYTDALAIPPAGADPELATRKAFDDAVRRALTHLSDPTKLATTPLLNLVVVGQNVAMQHLEDNRLTRSAALREILLELLDGLRPQNGDKVTSDSWRYYNCLYYPYVRGLGRRRAPAVLRQLSERRKREGGVRGELEQVLDWLLQVDEDTFYKWQRRGSDTIAAALREREAAAGGAVPVDA